MDGVLMGEEPAGRVRSAMATVDLRGRFVPAKRICVPESAIV